MDAEEFMKLYDFCWFELEIFNKQSSSTNSSSFKSDPDEKNQKEAPELEFLRIPSHHTRSMSDQLNTKTSFLSGSLSPDTVLLTPELQTIFSGKETTDFESPKQSYVADQMPKKKSINGRKKRGESKSLSDLEFQELKGFMDLGFVFSEEDRESSLASIIPGLQRLGKKDGEEEEEEEEAVDESAIPRPYLSEAWDLSDKRKKENPLMNWRIPALSNEIDMKDNLRWWAQTVASTVR